METIARRIPWVIIGALATALVAIVAGATDAGPLDPTGGPGSTLKTLHQVEPRTPIESLPYSISAPGSYYLAANLTGSAGSNGITINASDVTIDLNGFTLTGPPGTGTERGIVGDFTQSRIRVHNGRVREWGGGGVSFAGFDVIIDGVSAIHNGFNGSFGDYGIWVANGGPAVVRNCVVQDNGKPGSNVGGGVSINFGVLEDCTARNNWGVGITATHSVVDGCVVQGSTSIGISANQSTIRNCVVSGATQAGSLGPVPGIGIDAFERNVIEGNKCVAGFPQTNTNNNDVCIRVTGGGNRIEGNHVEGVTEFSGQTGYGIRVTATGNTIVKNSAKGAINNYSIAAGNTAGAIGVPGSVPADPWGNIQY